MNLPKYSFSHVEPSAELAPLASAAGMRIALFSGNYACIRDGANNALNRLVGHLLAAGAEVRVYSPTVAEPPFEPTGTLVSVPSFAIPGRSEYRFARGLPQSIRDDIRHFRPTLVHLSAPDLLNWRALRFARALNLPVVASLHTRFETYLEHYGLGLLRPAIERYLGHFYRGCDLVLAPNTHEAAGLRAMRLAPDRIGLWGRGVDQRVFHPGHRSAAWRARYGIAADEQAILFFGRLVVEKGVEPYADAIALLRARGHRIRPLIVGSGPAEPLMRRLVPDGIFTGHLDGIALGQAVANADILLNPSTTEAFGNVNLEAMAAGLAVVSADVGSARALIEPDVAGLLVPPEPALLADAVERLLNDPAHCGRIATNAAARAEAHRWPDILNEVVVQYRRLIAAS